MSDGSDKFDFNKEIDEQLAKPEIAEYVAKMTARSREADRAHAMTLAMARQAAQMTQVDLAEAVGITQGSIARQEGRTDMLLSSLRNYIRALGAELDLFITLPDGSTHVLSIDDVESGTSAATPVEKVAKKAPTRRGPRHDAKRERVPDTKNRRSVTSKTSKWKVLTASKETTAKNPAKV